MVEFAEQIKTIRKTRKRHRVALSSEQVGADVDSTLKFVRAILECYDFGSDEKSRIAYQTALIERRNKDKHLYLGVIGEFTSGKSTLINSMLGFRLLKSDILQGTTCTPTFIGYGEKFDVRVFRNDGTVLKLSEEIPDAVKAMRGAGLLFRRMLSLVGGSRVAYAGNVLEGSIEESKPFLFKYTADEKFCRDTKRVEIDLPCKECFLDGEIVVVDTPGLNAENVRHQEATIATLHEGTDLSLVLTQASFPCSEVLRVFVTEHLHDIQDRCICVVTQIDKIDEDEREDIIEDVANRFSNDGIHFKEVKGVSAICSLPEGSRIEERGQLKSGFLQFVQHLTVLLKEAKPRIIAKRLEELQDYLASECLSPAMSRYETMLEERKQSLAANRLIDFDSFIATEKSKRLKEFESLSKISDGAIENVVSRARKSIVDRLCSSISWASSKDAVKSALSKENISSVISSVMASDVQGVIAQMVKGEAKTAERVAGRFHALFNSEYRNLAGIMKDAAKFDNGVSVGGASINTDIMAGADFADYGISVGGAAAGALAGTALCPGIGTVIGAAIGFIASFAFWKDLSTYKREAREKVSNLADAWYGQVMPNASKAAANAHDTIVYGLQKGIESYSKYKAEITALIRREKAEQAAIDELISYMKDDWKRISMLRKQGMRGGCQ